MATPAGTVTGGGEQAALLDVDFGPAPEDVKDETALGGASDDTTTGGSATDDKAKGGKPDANAEDQEAVSAAVSLLGQEEYDKVKADPKALAKALHKSYTQKTQSVARYSDFVESFKANPKETLAELAKQVGLEVKDASKTSVVDEVRAKLAEQLGEDVADAILPAIKSVVSETMKPALDKIAALDGESALTAANSLIERFQAKYEDYPKFAAKMTEIGKKLLPSADADEFEYMEDLYKLAKGSTQVADEAREVIKRMEKSAAGAEKPNGGVPAARVDHVPEGGKVSFDDAWDAARRGIKFDPDAIRRARRESRSKKS